MTARERLIGLIKAWERDRVIDRPPDRDEMPLIVEACAEVAEDTYQGEGDEIAEEIRTCLKEATDGV